MFTLPNFGKQIAALAAHVPGPSQLALRVAFGNYKATKDGKALISAVQRYFLTEPSEARIALVEQWVADVAPQCSAAVAADARETRYGLTRQSGNGYGGY